MFRAAAVALFGLCFVVNANAQSLPSPSTWKNQRGSVLTIETVDPAGTFKGKFTNSAPGFRCQGKPYDASGRATGSNLFFVVTFTECNTVTRWRGRLSANRIPTTWSLRYVDAQTGAFRSLNGSDAFDRVP